MKMMIRPLLPVVGAVFLSFCSGNPGNPLDAGTLDAGTLDAGTLDAGTLDAGTPDGGRIDVNGKVVNTSGRTSANVVVVIKSGAAFSVITSTDADGKFSVANVPTPYDAAVVFGSGGATVSVGLTSTTPTVLDMLSGSPFLPASASLSGAVTGGLGFPSPPGYRTSVLFTSPEVQTDQKVMADLTTGDYVAARDYKGDPGSLFWSGPTTSTGTLHALQWRQEHPYDDDPYDVHVPSSYSGYGFKENVSLISGSTVTGQDIALTAVTPVTFAGTYTPPTGYAVVDRRVALKFGGLGLMLIVAEDLESATDITEAFSYTIPNIAGATLVLFNWASNGKAYSISLNTGLAVDATRVTTISPAAAELNFPLDNATEVTNTTPFSWTPVPGAVYLLRVTGRGYDQSVPWFYILTSATSATIPDLSQVILTSGASAAYQWEVSGVGPYADVEAAIAGLARTYEINAVLGLNLSSLADNPFLLNSNTYGFATGSGLRDFTTAGAWDY